MISAENLTKTYVLRTKKGLFTRNVKKIQALQGVSFEIQQGELVGYIGPNGAGKSTTVKILSGILQPDAGNCRVLGLCPWQQRMKHAGNIGVVFGQRSQLWWDLPVEDSFLLLRDIYKVHQEEFRRTMKELTEELDLGNLLDRPVRQLSLGQRMRCELAASLLHRPSVLFLDEPTIGLDAGTRLAVREFIRRINREQGVTMILTTHDMADIESLCSRVMLIGGGKKLLDGDISLLRKGREKRKLVCTLDRPPLQVELAEPGLEISLKQNRLEVQFSPENTPAARLIGEISEKYGILDMTLERTPIDRVVADMYAELAGGGEA